MARLKLGRSGLLVVTMVGAEEEKKERKAKIKNKIIKN